MSSERVGVLADAAVTPDADVRPDVDISCDPGFTRDDSGSCARWTSVPGSPHLGTHTTTLLDDGRVVVLGELRDENDVPTWNTVAVFDPEIETWTTQEGPLFSPRADWTATALDAHRILVVGSEQTALYAQSDGVVFDLDSAALTVVPLPSSARRREHGALRLRDGRVWIAGGVDSRNADVASTEVFDPVTFVWSEGPRLTVPRSRERLALLGADAVVVGGTHGELASTSEQCSFDTNECVTTGTVPFPIADFDLALTQLDQRNLLLVSFYGTAMYSADTNAWSTRPMPVFPRTSVRTVATLPDGDVLLVSMSPYEVPRAPELYDRVSDAWFATLEQPSQTWDGEVIALLDGRVLVTSSSSGSQLYERR